MKDVDLGQIFEVRTPTDGFSRRYISKRGQIKPSKSAERGRERHVYSTTETNHRGPGDQECCQKLEVHLVLEYLGGQVDSLH